MMSVVRAAVAATAALFALGPLAASAQNQALPDPDSVYIVDPVVVTATRGPRALSNSPTPISVMQRRDFIERVPNTVSDLFRTLPGLDVTGVGVSQVRPQIRGQGGQRILLLEDGLRMNNTRRQRDFGELPALVDLGAIEQVEVVRGPASVLYGSDAIGGVVNIITETRVQEGSRGSASYLFGSAASQSKASLRFEGRGGAFSFQGGGTWRNAGTYEAPAGAFGGITLANDVEVLHSGVEDRTFDTRFGWDVSESIGVFAKVEAYSADDTGFGFVHPDDYNPGDAEIEILYPKQRFTKMSGGLRARSLTNPLAQEVSLTVYGQDNERDLLFGAYIPFTPTAGLTLDNKNFTDIRTYGLRAEARKLVAGELALTYGVDGFQDNSEGRDNNTSRITGFGPPIVRTSIAPSIPHAQFTSLGAFVQGEIDVVERVSLVAGGRYQNVSADTRVTDALGNTPTSESNSTVVGALNAMFEVTEGVQLIGSVGRGFRSPNLVELFFDGAVPEANAYQRASQDLKAETSFNYDLGARYQDELLHIEWFYFRNEVSDGIRGEPVLGATGDTIRTAGLRTYQNVNVDKIRIKGVEVNADVRLASGFGLGGSFATLDAEDKIDPQNPVGESYSTKITGRAGYRAPDGRFWGEWETRYSGEQKDVALGSGNPLGAMLPSFVVHGIRGGIRLVETGRLTHGLTLAVGNLTDELYAETANGSFFRPEPKRNLTISWDMTF
ncbi:MAG: TonB-dependent receptor [Gemmatimonadetes bacterium]|nr:TonB-dependent receptor [Gemmatimonadota bacterium]